MAEEYGFETYSGIGRSVRAWVLVECGEPARAINELEANVPRVVSFFQIQASEMLAHAYLCAGRADRAVGTLDGALSKSERGGLHFYDAQLHRLKGKRS